MQSQGSFKIGFDTGIDLLYDGSFTQSTQAFGKNTKLFEREPIRRSLFQEYLNTVIGIES